MQKLENRIAALEAASAPVDSMTLIRRFVSPGQLDAEMHRLRDDDGKAWMRQPGENEQQLTNRASLEVKRNPWGIARLTADAGAMPHTKHLKVDCSNGFKGARWRELRDMVKTLN